ncbi:uncharacterized protein [Aegilops tauschii subsp. strangulata]|uniref:uncharacterized protein n=1 Tax=Aegilops tauschii subsp. strangulata TaxID=200361 RepID=UPI003CC874A2
MARHTKRDATAEKRDYMASGQWSQRNEPKKKMEQKWKPPPTGTLKINTDGAFFEAQHTGGWGFAIRNDHGVLLSVGAGNLENVSNPQHAEASALQQATNIVVQMGCHQVMFETDSMVLNIVVETVTKWRTL